MSSRQADDQPGTSTKAATKGQRTSALTLDSSGRESDVSTCAACRVPVAGSAPDYAHLLPQKGSIG